MSEPEVAGLRFEHRDGFGTGVASPRLSWRTETETPDWIQASYTVEATRADGTRLWSSGPVESAESVLVAWGGPPLGSRDRIQARVKVTGADGADSAWSSPVDLEVALLDPADWTAVFVTPDWEEDTSVTQPCPYLRKEFAARGGLVHARLYVTALGVYEIEINGARVGDHVLSPGWTSYEHRLRYETFDVTNLIRPGTNTVGAVLGEGWYRGVIGFGGGHRNVFGDRLALLAQLEITYADGSVDVVPTDDSWRATTGPLITAEIYNGETYDARRELDGWSTPGFDDTTWSGVVAHGQDLGILHARTGPPVRRTELVRPVDISESPSGRTIVDFGQNLVGRLRITVQGPAGTTIVLRHAEVLDEGELCTELLRNAAATDRYTLRGGPSETWEPRFTFHGFRYAEISGWPGAVTADDVVAVVVHSDMERTGWFECSDTRINRLHENIIWSMRGNFLDIPTDCPQRDERLGWTGDICVFSPTATFLYDCAGFMSSWLADLAADQFEDGAVPVVVPDVFERLGGRPLPPQAAWGDAAVVVPWVLYQRFGDLGILAAQYPSMCAWVDCILGRAGPDHLWDAGFQFADWLDPAAPPDRPAAGRTDPHLVATAYLAKSAEIVSATAALLGLADDAARYGAEADLVREAFCREYVAPGGRVVSDSQTGHALALEFGLLQDPGQRRRAGARLASLVRHAGTRIATGFVGTPLVCDALCNEGETDTAFRLLTQEACPSWLYPVSQGATTIWERWDALLPNGAVNKAQMNSFNHYALGAVGDWLHRTVGGLSPAAPGYARLLIRPVPGGGLTRAASRHMTPYGMASCAWELDGTTVRVEAVVPPNTAATVVLPGSASSLSVGSGTHRWESSVAV